MRCLPLLHVDIPLVKERAFVYPLYMALLLLNSLFSLLASIIQHHYYSIIYIDIDMSIGRLSAFAQGPRVLASWPGLGWGFRRCKLCLILLSLYS